MAPSVKEYMSTAQDKLEAAGIENPELDVRLLAEFALGWDQIKLFMNYGQILSEAEVNSLNAVIARRMAREPVSRIIGHRSFWKSEFKISPQTLDPRPDSETLIEAAVKIVTPPPAAILDLGTGSGCLLLSLLQEFPQAFGTGVDLSAEAVVTAADNAAALTLDNRARFIASSWEDLETPKPFDLVISNPPYISAEELESLEPEVAQYDPMLALAGGADGLDCYRSIIGRLPAFLVEGGWVLLEIGHLQANSVKSLLAEAGGTMLQVFTDLGGNDRIVAAKMLFGTAKKL